ncbi:DMT family transporter [Allopontixanthobacter sediminis]|uniref:EamA family transporter n=1 Tax=Allopontixanthobacter sediminis TaxID=1689985 RepID=A0A845B193_9SPHN|nr:DMT family transporter [Allopontixanthobacter sediminis]MXP45041.1 EamA family transporter [Allopontixanthobacter sediminis]
MANSTIAPELDQKPRWLLVAALLAGNVALALGPWAVRLADSGPVSAGFWRLFLALPFLAMLARANGERLGGIARPTLMLVLLAGVVFALDLASWHIGIEATRLGNATLFGNSGSLVLMIWGFVMWRRLPRGTEWLAMVSALAGAVILMGNSLEISRETLVGDLFCLLAGLFYAGYLLILQNARAGLGSWSLLTWSSLAGAPVLLAMAVLRGEPIWPTDWTPLVALFVLSQLVGQGLLVFSLKHFAPLIIGLALLTQPAVAALSGWYAFGETIGPVDLLGMALLGAALVLARGSKANPVNPEPAE